MEQIGSNTAVKAHFMIRDLSVKLVAASVIAMSVFGLLIRQFAKAGNMVDLMMIFIGIFAVSNLLKSDFKVRRDQLIILLMLATLSLSLAVSLMLNRRVTGLVQFVLYAAYLAPLLLVQKISSRDAYRVFLPLFVIIGVLQLPADLLFPNLDEHVLDMYSGTFQIANNKSRFLFLVLLASIFVYWGCKGRSRVLLLFSILAMLFSFKLGDSMFVYIFGAVSLLLGLFHRRKYVALGLALMLVFGIYYILDAYSDEPYVVFIFHRFFDAEHGAVAVVNYGFHLLKESYWMGSGLGEFISRASQSMGGLYVNQIPRTMVTYGKIYEETVAPTGLPAYVSIITEAGAAGIALSAFLIVYLYKNSFHSFAGFASFIYVLLLSMFIPMFYEGPDGAIFLYAYVLINKALRHRDELLTATEAQ
ncbi:MAG: hypothetical protein HY954_10890 [Deltaproteobacteria bacterium]|nr:hypothetical protein [Deltaproteobacteria bacterium]